MVELGRLAKDLPGRVVAKLEWRDPRGSIENRPGVALIGSIERKGVPRILPAEHRQASQRSNVCTSGHTVVRVQASQQAMQAGKA
jgi:hypothetical protein